MNLHWHIIIIQSPWFIPCSTFYGEGNGTPLQYSCLENPTDGGAWQAAVHGVATSQTRLSDFTFTFHFHALEKAMATHSSVLAWRIPGTGEPGGLPSMGLHRVGHDWSDSAAAAACSKGQNKCIMIGTHHCNITQYFHCPKTNPCSIHPSCHNLLQLVIF